MTSSGDVPWLAETARRADELFREWDVDLLPANLRRNSLDYYYLSVWPGLPQLSPAGELNLPARPATTRHAYIHIPFCSGVCDFCSYFLTVTRDAGGDPRVERYLRRLVEQARIHREETELALSYVYFGGGTPGLLQAGQWRRLLTGFADLGIFADGLLGTVELHPEVFHRETHGADRAEVLDVLDVLAEAGIKRVSLGFQTDDEDLLAATNRRHGAAFLRPALDLLRERGFAVNVDLMYGLPGQSLESWLRSLHAVRSLRPDSVATYFTFVDPGTRLWRGITDGKVPAVSHRQLQTQHIAARLALEEAGYVELPNDFYSLTDADPDEFVQDSLPSDANSIALGAGAYGYYPGVQHFNEFSFDRYNRLVDGGRPPLWRAAVLTPAEELCRDIMFSFKNAPALNLRLFEAKHGVSPLDSHGEVFARLGALGLVQADRQADREMVRLTPKGRLVAEEIACMFEPPRRQTPAPASPGEAALLRKHNFAPTYSTPVGGRDGRHGGQ
jgi:oxygen-independent coproporphyrinogen-3 oxidase